MPSRCGLELPLAAPSELAAEAQSAHRWRLTQQRIAAAVCSLLLPAAAVAISLYCNLPPLWNPPTQHAVARFYNPHPPLAYRLAGTDGPLRRAAAWCHGLAVLLILAPLCQPLLRLRRNAPIAQQASGPIWSARRLCSVPFALGIFHLVMWICLVQSDGALARATAALVALLGAGLGALSVWRLRRNGAAFLSSSHASLLLSVGLAMSVAAALLYAWHPPPSNGLRGLGATSLNPHYAREWALLFGATCMLAALVAGRLASAGRSDIRSMLFAFGIGAALTTGLNATLFWCRQPLPQFGEAVPGVLYHSGQPGVCSLALAQRRYGFRTLIYVHPDTNTAAHTEEVRFARRRGIRLIDAVASEFRPEDLFRLTRDPSACPVLLHCIQGKNRTPAWLAVYRVVEQGWRPPDAYAEMERISGRRLKTYVVEWVEKQAARFKGAAPLAKGQSQLP